MKYLCLVYSDEHNLHNLPDSPVDSECMAYAESLANNGQMIAGQALQPVATATTVGCATARCRSRMDPLPKPANNWQAFTWWRRAT